MAKLTIVLLFALAVTFVTAEQAVHRAPLCAAKQECLYKSVHDVSAGQAGSDKNVTKETVTADFSVAAVCEHNGAITFKLTLQHIHGQDNTGGKENFLTKYPMFATQSVTTGEISEVVSPKGESVEAADFKRSLITHLSFPAAPEVLEGTLTADIEYSFKSNDMSGPHTVRHVVRKHSEGITLLSTRTYNHEKVAADPDFNDRGIVPIQSGESKTEMGANGSFKEFKGEENISFKGPAEDKNAVQGQWTKANTISQSTNTDFTVVLDVKLVGTKAAAKEEPTVCTPGAKDPQSFLQLAAGPDAQLIAVAAPGRPVRGQKPKAFDRTDLALAKQLLEFHGATGSEIVSEVLRLSKLAGLGNGIDNVVSLGRARYEETQDPMVVEKLAAALATLGSDDAHIRVADMAADETLPADLRIKVLVALINSVKASDHVLKTVETIASSPHNAIPDDLRAAARLVLGALLHMHRSTPSNYVKDLVSGMEDALRSGTLDTFDRVAFTAALGNAAFPSSADVLVAHAADTQDRAVRLAALHGMRRMPLSRNILLTLANAARGNNTAVSLEARQLLKEVGTVTALQLAGPAKFTEGEGFGTEDAKGGGEVEVTLISATQEVSKSDIHLVKFTEGAWYTMGIDKDGMSHEIEGSGKLEVDMYSWSFEVLKVGISAETGEKAGLYLFVNIMGFQLLKKKLNGAKEADLEADLDSLLDITGKMKGASCSDKWGTGIAGDFGYTKTLFKLEQTFYPAGIALTVKFEGVGKLGIKPGMSFSECTNVRTAEDEKMFQAGLEPYASVAVNLEASLNVFPFRLGVGGELVIIDIGVPVYGEYYFTSGDLRAAVDFKFAAAAGRLYIFVDAFTCEMDGWKLACEYERKWEFDILAWESPLKGEYNIYNYCNKNGVTLKIKGGDGFMQIKDWRFGAVDSKHFAFSHKDGKTAMVFRSDGTVHPGPNYNPKAGYPECESRTQWVLKNWRSYPKFAKGGVDGSITSIHRFLYHENNYCAEPGVLAALPLWSREGSDVASNIVAGDKYIEFAGSWRIAEIDGKWLSLTHVISRKTAMIWGNDGSRHLGPRTDTYFQKMAEQSCTADGVAVGYAKSDSFKEDRLKDPDMDFVDIGEWRIADFNSKFMLIGSTKTQKTAVIYGSDGSVHAGNRDFVKEVWSREP